MRASIDVNVDAGESFGAWKMGDDADLLPLVSSVNVACGFHAGDPSTIARTVELAVQLRLKVGAHPSFPDLVGFGRRPLACSADEVYADVLYQVAALRGMVAAAGGALHHVKAHGALAWATWTDPTIAQAFVRAVEDLDPTLILYTLPGTALDHASRAAGHPAWSDGFPDRAYLPDLRLASRSLPNAVMSDPDVVARRALRMVRDGAVDAIDGTRVELRVDTLCVHGDQPNAVACAAAIRRLLESEGMAVGVR